MPKNQQKSKKIKFQKIIKNHGFERNDGHHELRAEKLMWNESRIVDFRATATRFMNIFVFFVDFATKTDHSGSLQS